MLLLGTGDVLGLKSGHAICPMDPRKQLLSKLQKSVSLKKIAAWRTDSSAHPVNL